MNILSSAVRIQLQSIAGPTDFGVTGKNTLGFDTGAWSFGESTPDIHYSVRATANANDAVLTIALEEMSYEATNAEIETGPIPLAEAVDQVVMFVLHADSENSGNITITSDITSMPDLVLRPGQIIASLYHPDSIPTLSAGNSDIVADIATSGDKISFYTIAVSA